MRAMQREEDHLYATALTRTAAVALFSAAVLLLPRTAAIRWWAVGVAVVFFVASGSTALLRNRYRHYEDWPWWVPITHQILAQAGAGFAGVAVGGVEGNQRFLSLLILVVTASYSRGAVVVVCWVIATVTIFWSALLSGLAGDVAFTVTATFGASAAAVASIVHLLLSRFRGQTRQVQRTATLAATIARADSIEHDLVEVLSCTSDVLGGPVVALSRVAADRSITPLAVYAPHRGARGFRGRRERDEGFDEEVLISATEDGPYLLIVHWPTSHMRRAVAIQTVQIVRDLLGHFVERAALISTLEHRTRTDPLTGLGNRRALSQWLRERRGAATVVILDLDYFKGYNDSHGHVAGDQLLRRFGALVQHHLRRGDCAVRLGGEEFCVALASMDGAAAEGFVTRLRDALAVDPSGVTFSAGVAVAERDELPEAVLARADVALYQAKGSGRNRTVVAPLGG
jgi:diguanylate cyclase (GGDEF)-like protein